MSDAIQYGNFIETQQISPDDGFPSSICDICVLNLSKAHAFKQLCEGTNQKLQSERTIKIFMDQEFKIEDIKQEDMNAENENNSNKDILCGEDIAENIDDPIDDSETFFLLDVSENPEVPIKARGRRRAEARRSQYWCDICGKSSVRKCDLIIHMRTHTGEKPYQCTECGARFSQWGSLTVHRRSHTKEKPYVCHLCGSSFSTTGGLARHGQTHLKETIQCKICNKQLTPKYYPDHLLRHTGERPFQCPKCPKTFPSSNGLSVHKRLHQEQGSHICPECGRACTNLQAHMRIHSGEKPFSCKFCHQRFRGLSTLNYHQLTHTDERNFPCPICKKCFRTTTAVKEHMQLHRGIPHLNCDLCDQKFITQRQLRKHVKTQHETPSEKPPVQTKGRRIKTITKRTQLPVLKMETEPSYIVIKRNIKVVTKNSGHEKENSL